MWCYDLSIVLCLGGCYIHRTRWGSGTHSDNQIWKLKCGSAVVDSLPSSRDRLSSYCAMTAQSQRCKQDCLDLSHARSVAMASSPMYKGCREEKMMSGGGLFLNISNSRFQIQRRREITRKNHITHLFYPNQVQC